MMCSGGKMGYKERRPKERLVVNYEWYVLLCTFIGMLKDKVCKSYEQGYIP